LFNIISNYFDFEDINVLDLFAGTGGISFEFASRGCSDIDLVEADRRICIFISRFIDTLGTNSINLVQDDAFKYIRNCLRAYDIVFADPPYDLPQLENLPSLIFENDLLKGDGWFIFEHSRRQDFSALPECFDKRVYGSVNFSFFKKV
ncbi:MAG: RsmD family RNA methyltransferase, partial [Bacteroidales bacterium]